MVSNEASRHDRRQQVGTRIRHRTGFDQFERKRAVLSQIAGALFRACCVAMMVAAPSLLLPDVAAETSQVTLVIAFLVALLVFMEYNGRYPSIIEFRFAPPFNRLRFTAAALTVMALSVIIAGMTHPTSLSVVLGHYGAKLGNVADFPYSPVRLMLLLIPPGADAVTLHNVRTATGLSYIVSLVMVVIFILIVRLRNWPICGRSFNVWVNLPLFDPTRGGDVVERLRRDAGVNVVLGILLPFMVPAVIKAVPVLMNPAALGNPQTLIWVTVAWAFLPASMLIRGIALLRVAQLIAARRKMLGSAAAGEQAVLPNV